MAPPIVISSNPVTLTTDLSRETADSSRGAGAREAPAPGEAAPAPSAAPYTYADLRGKTVLITGGTNGLGAAKVEAFARQGSKVHFCGRDRAAGERLSAATGAFFTAVDVTREDELKAWVLGAAAMDGSIGVLVNNAGNDPRRPLLETTTEQWDALFALNLRAYFIACREAVPFMREKGGAIINVGSVTYHLGYPELTGYVATKGGIVGFTRSLSREVGKLGIRANTLSPGWVMTDRQLQQHGAAAEKIIREVQALPEPITPAENAEVALFLASEASRAITGQVILADKGWAHN